MLDIVKFLHHYKTTFPAGYIVEYLLLCKTTFHASLILVLVTENPHDDQCQIKTWVVEHYCTPLQYYTDSFSIL